MKIYLNGAIIDENKAAISVFDRGFLYGDGVFETMRSYGGKVFRLAEHLNRLYFSMKALKIRQRVSQREAEKVVYGLLEANGLKDASIRMTISRGASSHRGLGIVKSEPHTMVITAAKFVPRPAEYYENGICADIARLRRNSRGFSSNLKALGYLDAIIARSEAANRGSFETIFLNEAGDVCEGSVTNIFMVKGNRVMTPSVSCGALPGITRKAVLELAPYAGLGTEEGAFTEEELKDSDEVFLTNSLVEIMPVSRIDDVRIGRRMPGDMTRKIHNLYKELIGKEAKI